MESTSSEYLYIFLHIPKCAGLTIRKHINKNFTQQEAVFLDYFDWRLNPDLKKAYKDYFERANDYFSRFSEKEKSKIKIIYGHTVPWGIHKFFKKKARYFTFVRNPKKRTLSMYNFFKFRYLKENFTGKKKDFYYLQFLVDGKTPNFNKWYNEKYAKKEYVTETMCQFLENYGYIEGGINRVSIKKALQKFYFIGLVKDFKEDSYYIYEKLKINKLFWNQNVSKKFVQDSDFSENKIKMDKILFQEASYINEKFIKTNKDFYPSVSHIKTKEISTVLNQFLFDTKQTFVDISSLLKRHSKIYFHFFNLLRGKG